MVQAVQSATDDAARARLTEWIAELMQGDNDERAGLVANVVIFDLNDALAITGEARTEGPRFDLLRAARQSLERLAAADPSNAGWQRDLSVSQEQDRRRAACPGRSAGRPQRLPGVPGGPAASGRGRSFERGLAARPVGQPGTRSATCCLPRAICRAPSTPTGNPWGWQSVWPRPILRTRAGSATCRSARNKIGDVLLAQGDLQGALNAYRESLGGVRASGRGRSFERGLAARPVGQPGSRSATCCLPRAIWPGALNAYRESLGVRERLAAADPSNAGWQRDLSVSHNKIGDVLLAQGDLQGALNAYRESLGVAERLAAADPSNAGWQRDLSVSQEQDRRRAACPGRSGGRPQRLPGIPGGGRASGRGRSFERGLAVRSGYQPRTTRRRAACPGRPQ